MYLSERLAHGFHTTFVLRERAADLCHFRVPHGGRYHCPGCGIPMTEQDGQVTCPSCDVSLDEYIYSMIEVHPHRP
jgi:rubrerythrin